LELSLDGKFVLFDYSNRIVVINIDFHFVHCIGAIVSES